jgi:4'-phosphopantetheinyl transferase
MTVIWRSPPSDLGLNSQDVHVWRANLDLPLEQVEEWAALLCAEETARAERFYFEQHRQRFIVARATLRLILGRYLHLEPQHIQFAYSDRGKPRLASTREGEGLQFNLSHSQGMALYALTRDRAIGVDVEHLRSTADVDGIAERFFAPQEYALLRALPAEEKERAFLQLWTAKEAYLKATGDGLAGSLERVEVSFGRDHPLHLLSIAGEVEAASRWQLYPLLPAPDYLATVAVEGQHGNLYCLVSGNCEIH